MLEAEEEDRGGPLYPPVDAVITALRQTTVAGLVTPTLLGAALRGYGVEPLLDSAVAFLPAPEDRPAPTLRIKEGKGGKRGSDSQSQQLALGKKEPVCALAFKVAHDRHRGPLVYLRVYSGTLERRQVLPQSEFELN